MRLVLASTSPRRSRLLKEAGFEFDIVAPYSKESILDDPERTVVGNAVSKARSVDVPTGSLVIGADTLVLCSGEVLGKPTDRKDAEHMLMLQLGHPQDEITGVCVLERSREREFSGFEVSHVVMEGDRDGIESYLDTGLWEGKAGGYGIQDASGLDVRLVRGERDNVEGLPMTLVKRLLSLAGHDYPDRTPSEGDGVS